MLALARKYRPRTFASVAVQSHVSNTLRGAIARGRVAHGYLLCGPRGVGKTTLARVLAMALNCEHRGDDGEPCGECTSCSRIWTGASSLDVVEIDAASNRGVDDARDLRERAMYAPSGDERYKVYIVDEAHMLTREAWNALLKILEEPPPRVVFVFATTEPQKIAQTAAPVLSRLQRFDLKRIGPADIRLRLITVLAAEGLSAEPDALAMIARAADGSMRDALSFIDQVLAMSDGKVTAARVREALGLVAEDEYVALLDIIVAGKGGDIFGAIARLADSGVDFGLLLTGFADLLRSLLAIGLGGEAPDVSEQTRGALMARKNALSSADLLRMLSAITELEPRFRKSGQQQLLLETLLVRFALFDRTVALEEILRGMGGEGPEGPGRAAGERSVSERSASDRPAPPAAPKPVPKRGAAAAEPGPLNSGVILADAAPSAPTARPRVDANALAERWGDVVDHVRRSRRNLLATLLEQVVPVGVTANGIITIQLEEPNETSEQALEAQRDTILSAIGTLFEGAQKLIVRHGDNAPTVRRMTAESIRDERVASLRKRDPVLDAAIDALDLELLD